METANGTPLDIRVEPAGDRISVLSLAGELDLSTIPNVEGTLFEELRARPELVIDLTQLVFIDSSGIGLLIRASHAKNGDGRMHFAVASGSQVERVFGLTRIDRVLPIFPSRERAIGALEDQPS
jgi:anti-sigma B factor antagonist